MSNSVFFTCFYGLAYGEKPFITSFVKKQVNFETFLHSNFGSYTLGNKTTREHCKPHVLFFYFLLSRNKKLYADFGYCSFLFQWKWIETEYIGEIHLIIQNGWRKRCKNINRSEPSRGGFPLASVREIIVIFIFNSFSNIKLTLGQFKRAI